MSTCMHCILELSARCTRVQLEKKKNVHVVIAAAAASDDDDDNDKKKKKLDTSQRTFIFKMA